MIRASKIWANEMNSSMNHASGTGSIINPVVQRAETVLRLSILSLGKNIGVSNMNLYYLICSMRNLSYIHIVISKFVIRRHHCKGTKALHRPYYVLQVSTQEFIDLGVLLFGAL